MEKVADFRSNLFSPFRIAALLLVSAAFAVSLQNLDRKDLARMDSMTSWDYIAYQRHLHSHGFAFSFLSAIVFGVIYIAIVETLTFVLRRIARAK